MDKKTRHICRMGLFAVLLVCLAEAVLAQEAPPPANKDQKLVEVHIYRLIMDPSVNNPVVLLSNAEEKRALPIWISIFEANAIYAEIMGVKHHRPLTHDLMERIVSSLEATLRRVIITHIKDNVYYASLDLEKDGSLIKIDARPSDSIALALKLDAPIFVAEKVFESLAVPLEKDSDAIRKYGLTLQDLTPALAKYLSFESAAGVLISSIRRASRAEQDGLKSGDIIVEINGRTIEDKTALKTILSKTAAPAKAKIYRQAAYLILTLNLE
jgi:bifunctional DNase/RNase